jgi:glucosyl-3-phosphoglycerate synthase
VTQDDWLARRAHVGADFDPRELVRRRQAEGVTVSVVLPTLDVGDTVGPIVEAVRSRWTGPGGLVDEVVVVDGGSSDDSARVAAEAGAVVWREADILAGLPRESGKGEALWKSLAVTTGDIVLWLDSDVLGFDPMFVPGMLGPLLTEPEVGYVKAAYRRPMGDDADGGGRVTELCARPLLSAVRPALGVLSQPLSGEAAGRRELLESVPFFTGYAVEIGLLLDIERAAGIGAIAQSDLGERLHHHQPTLALGRMAHVITQAVLRRAAQDGDVSADLAREAPYRRPVRGPDGARMHVEDAGVAERPPMASVRAAAP